MADEEYRWLAERLLAFPNPDGTLPSVQLLPGRLPDDALLSVPVPPNSTVVGSSIRWRGQRPPYIEVVLIVAGEETDIAAFYERELGQQGWKPAAWPSVSAPGGFVSGGVSRPHWFSRGEDGPILVVSIIAQEDGLKDVRVHTQDAFPKTGPSGSGRRAQGLVPVLRPPAGAPLWGGGGGGGEHDWTSHALGQTGMSPAELESHFARQLLDAGWTRVAGGATGPVASSTWIVPGEEEWHGLLVIAEAPASGRQMLLLRVDSLARSPLSIR